MLVFLSVCAAADARKVSGKVHSGAKALQGVIVTDGSSFTKTRGDGTFKLNADNKARFVYIITPSGYVADYRSGTPEFYKEASDNELDFNLEKTARSSSYTLFSVSDPQIRNNNQLKQFAGLPFEDLKAEGKKYGKKGPVVAIMLGDSGWDKNLPTLLPEYKKKISRLGFPVYTVTGNHDYNKERSFKNYSKDYFDNFGPYNYAFWMG